MFCSRCGSQVADDAALCPSCGQSTGAGPRRGIPLAPGGNFPPEIEAPQQQPQAIFRAPAPPSPAPGAPPLRYAGFWLRLVAYIIDYIVFNIAFTFISLPLMARSGLAFWIQHQPQTPEQMMTFLGAFARIGLLALFCNWLYFALLESSRWQATIGKKTLGLEVTDLTGRRISFARASGRYFGKIISAMIFFVGFFMIGFTEKKQGLHDMMAGCLVWRKI